jgi:pyruvate/2-oxoglutarate dehydrogenase complex dihydrolipoamide acyltransferase (E2) component
MSEAEVSATPAAAELAEANEVDLAEVEGTGSGGKVTVADVTAHVEAQGDEVVPVEDPTAEEGAEDEGENELKPITGNGAEPSETAPVPEFTLDTDVDTLDDTEYEGELPALILAGYWVKLGVHDDVPDEHIGAIANVVESPWTNVPFAGDSDETITGYRFDEEKLYLVKLRGSGEELLSVPAEAIADSAQDRPTLLAYA